LITFVASNFGYFARTNAAAPATNAVAVLVPPVTEPFSSCGEFVVLKDVDGFGESAGALRAGA
jgi:hypothetical protein